MSEQNNIVTPDFDPTKAKANQPKPPLRLTAKDAEQIGGALQRLHELRNQSIQTPTQDAEIAGLVEFLAPRLMEHAHELLGMWYVVRHEYEPLVNNIARILNRVNVVQAQAQVQKPTE